MASYTRKLWRGLHIVYICSTIANIMYSGKRGRTVRDREIKTAAEAADTKLGPVALRVRGQNRQNRKKDAK